MPKVKQYWAPIKKLVPDSAGYQAFETAGRRIGPLYKQTADDISAAGKLAAQGVMDSGKTLLDIYRLQNPEGRLDSTAANQAEKGHISEQAAQTKATHNATEAADAANRLAALANRTAGEQARRDQAAQVKAAKVKAAQAAKEADAGSDISSSEQRDFGGGGYPEYGPIPTPQDAINLLGTQDFGPQAENVTTSPLDITPYNQYGTDLPSVGQSVVAPETSGWDWLTNIPGEVGSAVGTINNAFMPPVPNSTPPNPNAPVTSPAAPGPNPFATTAPYTSLPTYGPGGF